MTSQIESDFRILSKNVRRGNAHVIDRLSRREIEEPRDILTDLDNQVSSFIQTYREDPRFDDYEQRIYRLWAMFNRSESELNKIIGLTY